MKLNLPIILTLSRIVMIPLFIIIFYLDEWWARPTATMIFVAAAITDWFDGHLARKNGEMTRFGAFLDPVADKLMVTVVLVLLVDVNPTPYEDHWLGILAIIIIGREITISALREWMAEIGASAAMKVSYIAKVKTTAQLVALPFLIHEEPWFGVIPVDIIGFWLLFLAAVLTIWSMTSYMISAWPAIRDNDGK